MSDLMEQHSPKPLKRENDSMDDFEHLEHELERQHQQHHLRQPESLLDLSGGFEGNLLDDGNGYASTTLTRDLMPVPATPPPSADSDKFEGGARSDATIPRQDELEARIREHLGDAKAAAMALLESEKSSGYESRFEVRDEQQSDDDSEPERSEPTSEIRVAPPVPAHGPTIGSARDLLDDEDDMFAPPELGSSKGQPPTSLYSSGGEDFMGEIRESSLPEPERSPELDFVRDEIIVQEARVEKPAEQLLQDAFDRFEPPQKPLPPEPLQQRIDDFLAAESWSSPREVDVGPPPPPPLEEPLPKARLGDATERKVYQLPKDIADEIAPKHIFRDIGIDAWFNPDKLNPKVASLIYWRDPKKSGIVFGAILGVLLSLAYFSLISVLAYISLLTLTFTVAFRIYKTVLQAIQKTNDGHPFKEILDLDLTLPTEKVHQLADIAVSNANAALSELRRLFLVEDFVDSLKFGILLWSLTYLGSWFNGMTLVIIGVVALFTLPKVYETNKTQIDQNLALVHAKINEITAKVKAAIPMGKKAEPTKEE